MIKGLLTTGSWSIQQKDEIYYHKDKNGSVIYILMVDDIHLELTVKGSFFLSFRRKHDDKTTKTQGVTKYKIIWEKRNTLKEKELKRQ